MRVLYDYQAFSMQRYGGVSRYVAEIVSGIRAAHPEIDAEFAGRYAANEYLAAVGETGGTDLLHRYGGRGRGSLLAVADALNARRVERRMDAGGIDIYHPTYYHTVARTRSGGPAVVLTVHDMIHELFAGVPDRERVCALKRRSVERADRIVAVSAHTAADLQRLLAVPAEKITVIHHGCPLTGREPDNEALALPERFVLYVGARTGYKNFAGLLEAIAPLMAIDPGLTLVCAGAGAFTPAERELAARLGIAGRLVQTPADDASLATQYRGATLFVCPSRYEGFGLPLLEAMTLGCPSAASGVSSLPEVGGEAAAYFDPASPEDMGAVIGRLLADPDERERLADAGLKRARLFSWDASAEAHAALYCAASAS